MSKSTNPETLVEDILYTCDKVSRKLFRKLLRNIADDKETALSKVDACLKAAKAYERKRTRFIKLLSDLSDLSEEGRR